MTPRPASHNYSSPCMSVRRMRLSTTGVDRQSMPRYTPCPRANPPTEPTIQILISEDLIIIIKIRCSSSHSTPVNNNTKSKHPPYWNDDPRVHWLGPLNVGYAIIDGRREQVVIDSGAQSNAVMPAYVKEHKLKVGPVHDLALHPTLIPISGIGGHMATLGYVNINIQVEGIPSYY